ncbi:MAG: NUDIX domain-containing protein [Pseudomonadota bacterium]
MSVSVRAWVASVVVLRSGDDGTEVLLMRRTGSNAGTWCQVAGRIEPGETAWQAGLRELREETGFTPESFWSADICEQFYEADRDTVTVAPVFVAWVGPGAEPTLNEEHDAHRWLGCDDAIDAVSFGGQRRMLRDIRAEFVDRTPSPDLRIDLP